ncbi:hypothetical protein A5886_001571 [Enterococcus sp. 8G7_MSG3316]|uniref:EbsA n=1 Tax=Candidatus Enterococcus testudinis TaxID=1834191 RepID=A0A242A646_9ENTE|nr:EbsA family protein [Enterococcus sp. 8G7_MSG3316]OTN76494.1 hypothetical protein A5886_001571 [Enterococcus sp. 8G7_MSG3316]
MKRKFNWQPEAATAIIYWSVTLIILFYSLILALENTGPYWKSNLVLVFFGLFVYLGLRRKVLIEENKMTIRYARIWKKKSIQFAAIDRICIEGRMLKLSVGNEQWTAAFRKHDLIALAACLSDKTSLHIISGMSEKQPPIE